MIKLRNTAISSILHILYKSFIHLHTLNIFGSDNIVDATIFLYAVLQFCNVSIFNIFSTFDTFEYVSNF